MVEVACNNLQPGPRYVAGMVLRFARVKRYRPDNPPEQADKLDTVHRLKQLSAHSYQLSADCGVLIADG